MLVTTSRADYGILSPLLTILREEPIFKVDLVVTGAHLDPLYGKTVREMKRDGFQIAETVPIRMKGDRESHICDAVSQGLRRFSKLFQKSVPDLVIVVGDRYELLSVSIAAVIHKVPIAHIHGGEMTLGATDDVIRHAMTKMASLHFPSMEPYARRIIQMGEHPERVHVVGALSLDTIRRMELMDRRTLSNLCRVDFEGEVALMTYHPVTQDDYDLASQQTQEIVGALAETDLSVLVTMPNADTGNRQVYQAIQKALQNKPEKFKLVKNLGQKAYLSAMCYARLMIGNSSSGLIESASFKIPVVNIGDRQEGRIRPLNVIDCDCSKESILNAIRRALSQEFRDSLSGLKNPYGEGDAAYRIIQVLKAVDLRDKSKLLKKGFYDFPWVSSSLPKQELTITAT